ncbi:hypothetical protein B0H14DRAFT_3087730 [Mycena olivaceomarginata]|nr:hypothetical protein B0H14DRAFT_3087730 [Mycena olivaceomarginata]
MGDRNDLDLWYKSGSLVEAAAAVCNNTIAVIHSVGSTWEQTGAALVDVLYGVVNPSGRLPFSIDQAEASYRTTIVYNSLGFPVVNYAEQLLIDYRCPSAPVLNP